MTNEIEIAITNATGALLSPWLSDEVAQLAGQQLPDAAGGRHGWLLRGDAKLVQMRWAVEAVTGPELNHMSLPEARLTVFRRAYELVGEEFSHVNIRQRQATARKLQEIALALWRMRNSSERTPIARSNRYALIVSFKGSQPYCWICGVRFSSPAIDAFVDARKFQGTLQPFVDFTYPRGRNKSDLAITVDHLLPVSAGGDNDLDNLRLSCSWCNISKSDALDIYRPSSYRGEYTHPYLGEFRLPSYGWIARLLAMANGCSRCGSGQEEGPLVVAATSGVRQLNPAYLRTYCDSCDPWREWRMVTARSLPC